MAGTCRGLSPVRVFFVAVGVLLVLHNALFWPARSAAGQRRPLPPDAAGAAEPRAAADDGAPPPVVLRGCAPAEPSKRVTRPLNLLPLALDRCAPGAAADLCAAAARVARGRAVVLVPVCEALLDDWAEFARGARLAGAGNVLALAVPPDGASAADAAALLARVRGAAGGLGEACAWAAELAAPAAIAGAPAGPALDASAPLLGGAAALDAARALVSAGLRVLLADAGVCLRADPTAHLHGDHDLEAHAAHPAEPAHGQVVSLVDLAMGWSRNAQSLAVSHLAPDLFALAPTAEAAALAARLARTLRGGTSLATPRLAEPPPRDGGSALEYALTAEALTPSHDSWRSAGASVRLLPARCYATADSAQPAGGLVALALPPGTAARAAAMASVRARGALPRASALPAARAPRREHFNELLKSAAHDATPAVLASRCAAELPHAVPALRTAQAAEDEAREAAGEPRRARPLNFVLPSSAQFPPPAACAARGLEALCAVLSRVAGPRREALVAVSNKNILPMLQLYIDGVKRAGIPNALVVALDDETGAWLAARDFPSHVRKLTARGGSTDNHATSGLKFALLGEFLSVGCSVLLSDVDIAWMRDPFPALYGDSDVEGMTDGFDDVSAYGAPGSAVLGGGRSAFRIFARNSGMFYIAATNESLRMMERMAHRMATESVWDQTAYNEEQFFLSVERYQGLGLSQRVMNYLCFLNTKVLFRYIRHEPLLYPDAHTPIGAHVNYHPEKPQRMVDIFKHYQQGQRGVLERWNGGEGLALSKECEFEGVRPSSAAGRADRLVGALLAAGKATWGGVRGVRFGADGALATPWGAGTWGGVPGAHAGRQVWLNFFGNTRHLLKLQGELPAAGGGLSLTSMRCTDGDLVKVLVSSAADD